MNSSFFDALFTRNALIAFVLALLVLFCCYVGPSVHLPFLAAILGGVGIGFLEPKRGWALCLWLVLLVLAGGFLMKNYLSMNVAQAERTQFVAYLTFFPALAGGFLGSFFKKAFQ